VRLRHKGAAADRRRPAGAATSVAGEESHVRVQVITDSTAAIPAGMRAAHHVVSVPLNVVMGDQSISEDDLDEADFYARLVRGDQPVSTTQPPLDHMRSAFAAPAARGQDAVGVFISAELSGTFSAATLAREMVLAEHPQTTIELVDSRTSAMNLGLGVLAAAKAAQAGACVADVAAAAQSTLARTRILFIPASLEYLRRGGRIGGAAALLGTLLRVTPILTTADGLATVYKKVRTRARAVSEMLAAFSADIASRGLEEVVVEHSHEEAAATHLATLAHERCDRLPGIMPIPAVIGVHVGPDAVALVWTTQR
jgi:DegV family protein with EDD domain